MKLDIGTLFDSALIMFIPVLAGIAAAKLGYFKNGFSKMLSSFVLNIAQPFMLVTSMLGIEYSEENLYSGLMIMLAAAVVHGVAAVIAFLTTCKMKDRKAGRISEFCMIFSNCGFFGFPLLRTVYGEIGVFWGGFYAIVFNIAMWTYGVFILSRANREMKIRITKIFLNNGSIPCILGFILYILRFRIYQPIYDSMDLIGSTCTPLSMIIIGAMIAEIPIKRLISDPHVYFTSFIHLIVLPVVCGIALKLFGFSREIAVFGALMMSLPSAAASAMFAESYDIRPELAAQTVGISTLLAVGTVPMIMQLVSAIV